MTVVDRATRRPMESFFMGGGSLGGRAVAVTKAVPVPSRQGDRTAGHSINVSARKLGLLGITAGCLTKMPEKSPATGDRLHTRCRGCRSGSVSSRNREQSRGLLV